MFKILCIVLMFALFGCGSKTDNTSKGDEQKTTQESTDQEKKDESEKEKTDELKNETSEKTKNVTTACTDKDWIDQLCSLPISKINGGVCANAERFRYYCANDTVGCELVGGCSGNTPAGHWYPLVDDKEVVSRCKCNDKK